MPRKKVPARDDTVPVYQYECHAQSTDPDATENVGCRVVFESAEDLPPSKRLCPNCQPAGR